MNTDKNKIDMGGAGLKNYRGTSLVIINLKKIFQLFALPYAAIAFAYQWNDIALRVKDTKVLLHTLFGGDISITSLVLTTKGILVTFIGFCIETGNTIAISFQVVIGVFCMQLFSLGMLLPVVNQYKKGSKEHFIDKYFGVFVIGFTLSSLLFLAYHLLIDDYFGLWPKDQHYLNKIIMSVFGWVIAGFISYAIRTNK